MELMVLAVPGCPNAPLLEQRMATALADRPAATVARRVITNASQAARWGMHGSPTLLINGTDPFATLGAGPALACRLYPAGDGRLDGAPTVAELRRVLEQQPEGSRPQASAPAPGSPVTKAGMACAPGSRAGQAGGGCRSALWGWSPPDLPADTPLKRRIDRLLPRTGWAAVLYFAAIVGLLNLAPHLPERANLAADGLAAVAAAAWCGVNLWRCRHAHCVVTSVGWLALSVLAFTEAVLGRSLIGGDEQPVFLAVLGAAILFEAAWYCVRGTNSVAAGPGTGST